MSSGEYRCQHGDVVDLAAAVDLIAVAVAVATAAVAAVVVTVPAPLLVGSSADTAVPGHQSCM